MGWKNKPTNFALEIKKVGDEHLRKVSAEMLQAVIMGSPVMDGSFRNSNLITIDRPTYHYIEGEGRKLGKVPLNYERLNEKGESVTVETYFRYLDRVH